MAFPSPKPLENRCRAFCCAELPLRVTPVWGEKRKIEKYVFLSSLPCPPTPLKLSNPFQTVTSSIDKSRHGKNAWVSIDLAIIGHLTFTVRRSLAQTWHLWIDCSADGNIRLTRRNVNKTQPALASSDATRYTNVGLSVIISLKGSFLPKYNIAFIHWWSDTETSRSVIRHRVRKATVGRPTRVKVIW